jgi:hypothetical protein|tara:strand:- start:1060 stop:1596 length:537 start_codon:yes stop_codon:yes gene_type:complete
MPIPFDKTTVTMEKKEFTPIPEGKYFTNITEYNEPKEITTRKGAICDVLKLTLSIDGSKHPDLEGRKIWADVWITKTVNGQNPSSSDNVKFFKFLEAIDYPLDNEEAEIDGVKTPVLLLPQGAEEIFSEEIEGKPLMVTTYIDNWTDKEGKLRQTAKVKYFEKWEGGSKIEDLDDLPF